MKLSKLYQLILATLLVFVATARADLMDIYGGTRSIVVTSPTVLTATTGILTNGPVDLHAYIGKALILLNSCTNSGAGVLTCTIQTSPDTTNWYALTNFALIPTTTQISYTNGYYGGTLAVSNNYLLPGTITSATAGNSSNAFAGTWLNYNTVPFTNSGAVTVTTKGVYLLGFNVQSQPGRYLQIYWTPTGTSSNDTVAAALTGVRQTEVQ